MKTINNSKEIFLKFDLQGFEKDEIKIKLSKNSLMVKAIKNNKKKVQEEDFFHSEKYSKKFNYVTTLPKIDTTKAKIEFKKGILKIRAPKI